MIDGAHNAPAAEALAAALEREFPSTSWALVFGAMADKEIGAMLTALAPRADALYAVAADSPRAAAPDDLVELAAEHDLAGRPFASVTEGVAAAVADVGELGAVLVTGSLYVAGEARLALGDGR